MLMRMNGVEVFLPSRLFMYYTTRQLQHTEHTDWGSYLPSLMASVDLYGICPEDLWPFARERVLTKPDQICYETAKKCRLKVDFRDIQTTTDAVNHALVSRRLVLCIIRSDTHHMILLTGIDFRNQHLLYIDPEVGCSQTMPFAVFEDVAVCTCSISIRLLFHETPERAIVSDAADVIDSGRCFDAVFYDRDIFGRRSGTSSVLWVDPRDSTDDPRDITSLMDLLRLADRPTGILRLCSTEVIAHEDDRVLLQVSSSTSGDSVLVHLSEVQNECPT